MAARMQQQIYDKDFYAWAMQNAKLLRQKKLSEIDSEHIAEELESMGNSEKRELVNRLAVLLAHLLKWEYQPDIRGNSWKYTIREQQFQVDELLKNSPSLNHGLEKQLIPAYQRARLIVAKETGINITKLPKVCPFTLTQALKHTLFSKK